jgi:T5SS/PEP-CTERM-associated repeat protein
MEWTREALHLGSASGEASMIHTAPRRNCAACKRWSAVALLVALCGNLASANAAIGTAGDVSPIPPTAGGNVVGPFRIGNTGTGAMTIADGILLTNTNATILGDTVTGIGIVVVDNSTWNMTTSGADLTVANSGAGSLRLVNFGTMNVNDSLFVASQLNSLGDISVTGFGTILRGPGAASIAERGQAVVTIQEGGRLLTGASIVGDEFFSNGRVTLLDQFSLWRTSSSLTIANAGRGALEVLDGARVENTSGTIGSLAGSTGTVEVAGLGSLWQNTQAIVVGDSGHGTLRITDGGFVTTGTGAILSTIGRQAGSTGQVEVRGLDSLLSVSLLNVGGSGDGSLRILEGGRLKSANVILGDNATARGTAIVDGLGSTWEITGDLAVSDPGEARLTISNEGLVRTTSLARVGALGRLALDSGRLDIGSAMGLANIGVVEGNGTIDSVFNNNAGGQLRPHGAAPLIITGTLNNAGLIDIQSGELEVFGATNNNLDIDARDGAVLRFRGTGLDNNSGAQLAITTGVVDVFGAVDNNVGAEIAVGSTAVAVFHDPVTNNGTLFMQPGGKVLILEDLAFGAASVLNLPLQAAGAGKVDVVGAAQLAGDLQVKPTGEFIPLPGDQFTVLSSGGLGGTSFATVSGDNPHGLQFFPIYSTTDVTIFTAAAGERTWGVDAGGQTSVASNWFGGVAPSGENQAVAFSTVITGNRTIEVDAPLSLARLRFDDDNNYTIAGPQTITLAAPGNDPATIVVDNIHGNGAHTIGASLLLADDLAIVQQSSGALVLNGALNNAGGNTITKSGAGTLIIAGAQSHGPGAVLTISAGIANVNTNAGSNTARNTTVNANSSTNFGSTQHLAALNVGPGATATITSDGPKNVVTNALSIAGGSMPTGKLDVTNNAVIVDYPAAGPSPETTIRAQIISGRGLSGFGATWTGLGIASSTAAAANATEPESRSIGYAENASLPLGSYTTFRGQAVDDTSVIMAFTRTGDANLDGIVNDDDVTIVGATYAPGVPQPHWALGDFDYNGFVDDDDVTLLGVFYDPSATPLIAPGPSTAGGVTAVPEPTTITLLGMLIAGCAIAALRRRMVRRA